MNIKELREEYSRIHVEVSKLVDESATRELTEDETKAKAEKFARLEKIQTQLDDAEKLAKYAFEAFQKGEPVKGTVIVSEKSAAQQAYEAHVEKSAAKSVTADKIDREQFGRALSQWTLTGSMPQEYAALTSGTSSSAFLPKQVGTPVVTTLGNQLRAGMAIVGVAPIKTDGTAEMNVPVISAAAGTDLTEDATTGVENATNGSSMFGKINLKCVPIQSGQVWISNLELSSLDYDMLGAIVPGLQDAKETRIEQKAFAAMIADAGITQTVAAASTIAITYDNLVDLNRRLSTRYDRAKVIFLSVAAYAAAEKLTDDNGMPILNRDPQNQSLMRFNGTPVLRSDYLEAFGASKVVGMVISFVGFKLRDAGQEKLIRHVDDKDYVDQTGANLIGYHAYGYVAAACATLKTPAS